MKSLSVTRNVDFLKVVRFSFPVWTGKRSRGPCTSQFDAAILNVVVILVTWSWTRESNFLYFPK